MKAKTWEKWVDRGGVYAWAHFRGIRMPVDYRSPRWSHTEMLAFVCGFREAEEWMKSAVEFI